MQRVASHPQSSCQQCESGTTDYDTNPSTPCVQCEAGKYGEDPGHTGDCIHCPSGTFAPSAGGTSLDACEGCEPGQYSAVGSSSCGFCSAGRADEDEDASTDCTDCSAGTYAGCGETSCNACIAGQIDADSNAATPCVACLAGQYWEAGHWSPQLVSSVLLVKRIPTRIVPLDATRALRRVCCGRLLCLHKLLEPRAV